MNSSWQLSLIGFIFKSELIIIDLYFFKDLQKDMETRWALLDFLQNLPLIDESGSDESENSGKNKILQAIKRSMGSCSNSPNNDASLNMKHLIHKK